MATCLCSELGDVRGVSCGQRAARGPHELQPSKDGDHGDSRLQLVCGNSSRQQATEHHSRNTAEEKLKKYRHADGAKSPIKSGSYNRQYQSKEQVCSDNLGRRHFGIVQKKNCSERSSTRGRKSGFHSNRQSKPGKPAMVFSGEGGILHAPDKSHAG